MLKKVFEALLDLIYPPRCIICQRFIEPKEKPVCRACLDRLPDYEGADPQVKYAQRCVATFFYEKDLREAFLRFQRLAHKRAQRAVDLFFRCLRQRAAEHPAAGVMEFVLQ